MIKTIIVLISYFILFISSNSFAYYIQLSDGNSVASGFTVPTNEWGANFETDGGVVHDSYDCKIMSKKDFVIKSEYGDTGTIPVTIDILTELHISGYLDPEELQGDAAAWAGISWTICGYMPGSWDLDGYSEPGTGFDETYNYDEGPMMLMLEIDKLYSIYAVPRYGSYVNEASMVSNDIYSFAISNVKWGYSVSINPTESVPEPSTILLFGSGIVGLAVFSRKKIKSNHIRNLIVLSIYRKIKQLEWRVKNE